LPKISVIIPVYNNEATINKCIDSILVQTFRDFELILVNDGSSDESLSICKRKEYLDSRVKVFTQNNLGVSIARNKGIIEANGEYICFADADDMYMPTAFEIVMALIEKNNVDMVVGSIKEKKNGKVNYFKPFLKDDVKLKVFKGKNLKLLKRWTMEKDSKIFMNDSPDDIKLSENFRIDTPWAKFIKSKYLKENMFNTNLRLSEDIVLMYDLLSKMNSVLISDDIVYTYNVNSNSITQKRYDPNIIGYNMALTKELLKLKADYDSSFEQSIYMRIVNCYWDSIVRGISSQSILILTGSIVPKKEFRFWPKLFIFNWTHLYS